MNPDYERINYLSVPGKAEMWSDKDDISWMVFAEGSEISGDDMQELVKLATRNVQPGDILHVLIDMSAAESISAEAREFAAGKDIGNVYDALAIVAGSPATKLVANFFIRFHKPPRPTRIFNKTEDAVNWLKSLMK